MTPDHTELQWVYEPAGFFEAPYQHVETEWQLKAHEGHIVAILKVPQDPVDPKVERQIREHLESVILVRTLQVHHVCHIHGPSTSQLSGEHHRVSLPHFAVKVGVTVGFDMVCRDPSGAVQRDTKAERIREHSSMLNRQIPMVSRFPLLRSLYASYGRAVSDPANELVYLYEVRDALSKHHGGKDATLRALEIDESEWDKLGALANYEPLEEGRHRGKNTTRREASVTELDEARAIARKMISTFGELCESYMQGG